jgi:hypothetical protein
MPQGGQVQLAVSVARTNFTGNVTVTVSGAPTGVTSTVTQPTGTGAVVSGTIIFVAAASTAPGAYPITVQASGTGVTSVSATLALTISAVGSYTITGNNTAATAAPNGTALVLLGVVRNNFDAPITMVVDSLPAGVTATFTPNPVVFNATSLLLTVGPNVALRNYNLAIRGTAAGFPDRTVPLTLTVAALGSFTLSATPSPATVAQGTNRAITLSISRTGGFSGLVLLTVEGAPAGLTASLNPPLVGTSSSTLTLTAAANLAAGNYTLTIRGVSPGVADQTIQLPVQVTVSTGGTGNVTLDFSSCVGFDVPAWVAWQDGNGAWTRVTPTGKVYQFTVTASTAGFAYVLPGPTTNSSQVLVQYMSRAEMSAAPFVFCGGLTPALKVVNGSVTGLSGSDAVNISLGGGLGFANPSIPTFAIAAVQNGAHDLIAWRHDLIGDITGGGNPDRGFVRRDQDIPSGGSVGALNMNGSESFSPSSAVFNVSGIVASDEMSHTMRYYTGASCIGAMLYSSVRMSGNTFIGFGFSAAVQRPTDYHQVTFTSTTRQSGVLFPVAQRTLSETFRAMGARNLTLGAQIAPTVTTLAGNYKRLQAVFTLAPEYASGVTLAYNSQSKSVTIVATPAWLGGSNVTLSMPNFSGIVGWNDIWPPASGATGQWTVSAVGTTLTGPSLCVENARTATAMRAGSY